jgi:drug/metabolite transporter (DMT)-like permease
MGGAVVVTTAIFSRIILSIKMNRFQIIGCILTVLGAGIVGFGESFKQQSAEANV